MMTARGLSRRAAPPVLVAGEATVSRSRPLGQAGDPSPDRARVVGIGIGRNGSGCSYNSGAVVVDCAVVSVLVLRGSLVGIGREGPAFS